MRKPPLQSILDQDLEYYGCGRPEPRHHEFKVKVNLCKAGEWWRKLFRNKVRECDLDKKIEKMKQEEDELQLWFGR